MIASYRHKGLKELKQAGASRRIAAELAPRIRRRLDALDAATAPGQMNVPGFDFHPLRGKPRRYGVHVNGPWCLTFGWDGENAIDVDLENYH